MTSPLDLDALLTDALRGMFPHRDECPRGNVCWCGAADTILAALDAVSSVVALRLQEAEQARDEAQRQATRAAEDVYKAEGAEFEQRQLKVAAEAREAALREQIERLQDFCADEETPPIHRGVNAWSGWKQAQVLVESIIGKRPAPSTRSQE